MLTGREVLEDQFVMSAAGQRQRADEYKELSATTSLQVLNGVGNQVALALERTAAEARSEQYARQLADRVEVAEAKYQTLVIHCDGREIVGGGIRKLRGGLLTTPQTLKY
jgi:hypothetical protein